MPLTPNMGLLESTPLVTLGPLWAQNIEDSLLLIDAHDHSSGKGLQISPPGLNINSELSFQSQVASNLFSTKYISQGASLPGTEQRALYAVGNELYFNDGAGTPVQITAGGSVNVSGVGGISGMGATTAAVTYYDFIKTFVFTQNAGITASVDHGPLTIRENIFGAQGITLQSPAALASSYSITMLPSLPLTTQPIRISPTGVLSAASLDGSMLVSGITLSGTVSVGALTSAGAVTINGGGLDVNVGGINVDAGGILVNAGGIQVASGGGNIATTNTNIVVGNSANYFVGDRWASLFDGSWFANYEISGAAGRLLTVRSNAINVGIGFRSTGIFSPVALAHGDTYGQDTLSLVNLVTNRVFPLAVSGGSSIVSLCILNGSNNGAAVISNSTGGVTCALGGAGVYNYTFTTPFLQPPSIAITIDSATNTTWTYKVTGLTTAGCTITTANTPNGGGVVWTATPVAHVFTFIGKKPA